MAHSNNATDGLNKIGILRTVFNWSEQCAYKQALDIDARILEWFATSSKWYSRLREEKCLRFILQYTNQVHNAGIDIAGQQQERICYHTRAEQGPLTATSARSSLPTWAPVTAGPALLPLMAGPIPSGPRRPPVSTDNNPWRHFRQVLSQTSALATAGRALLPSMAASIQSGSRLPPVSIDNSSWRHSRKVLSSK